MFLYINGIHGLCELNGKQSYISRVLTKNFIAFLADQIVLQFFSLKLGLITPNTKIDKVHSNLEIKRLNVHQLQLATLKGCRRD